MKWNLFSKLDSTALLAIVGPYDFDDFGFFKLQAELLASLRITATGIVAGFDWQLIKSRDQPKTTGSPMKFLP